MGDVGHGLLTRRREGVPLLHERRVVVTKFSPAVEDAIRGIRANAGPRRTMVLDRRLEWGGALVKQAGVVWVVTAEGRIVRSS